MANQQAIAQAFESIVGSDAVYPWAEVAPQWQVAISPALTPQTEIACLVFPKTQPELAEVVACAQRQGWPILPCGQGTKLSWGGLATGVKVVVSTACLTQLVEHAIGDLTVTVEAGMPFAQLQTHLATAGQCLAFDPAYPKSATLGGMIATGDTGSLRQRYGGVRDMLLGLSFCRSDGQIAKAGGRVVKNVAGYDLMKLFTGSYGTLGLITQATFRLYPLPQTSQTVVLTGEPDAIAIAIRTLVTAALTPTQMDLLSTTGVNDLNLGQGLGLVVRFQGGWESVKQQATRSLEMGHTLGLTGQVLTESDDVALWQALQKPLDQALSPTNAPEFAERVLCKVGLQPTAAVPFLQNLEQWSSGTGLIHAGSGIGRIWGDRDTFSPATLLLLREFCQAHGGFLSILQAPLSVKQSLEVWGYPGNALGLMQRLKHQFDPQNLFSPQRFVGGI